MSFGCCWAHVLHSFVKELHSSVLVGTILSQKSDVLV